MYLTELQSMHYRNLRTPRLELSQGIHAIIGANAAGKSNILDACYLALTGSLARGTLAETVQLGQQEAFVGAHVVHRSGMRTVKIGLRAGYKAIKLDGQKVPAMELAKTLAAVLISPDDIALVQGSPSQRRRFLDNLLAQLSLRYAMVLREYGNVVDQRNRVLKMNPHDPTLTVWNRKFVQLADEINQTRSRALQRIEALAQASYYEIAGEAKKLETPMPASQQPMAEALAQSHAEEHARRLTVVGPHRDDLSLLLDGHEVRRYGSRGEARTTALALQVSAYRLLQEKHGEAPVLLLDDFGAELDQQRRRYLLALASQSPQALVTGTEAPPQYTHLWQVEAGTVKEVATH